jgi:hypothetical protein
MHRPGCRPTEPRRSTPDIYVMNAIPGSVQRPLNDEPQGTGQPVEHGVRVELHLGSPSGQQPGGGNDAGEVGAPETRIPEGKRARGAPSPRTRRARVLSTTAGELSVTFRTISGTSNEK